MLASAFIAKHEESTVKRILVASAKVRLYSYAHCQQ